MSLTRRWKRRVTFVARTVQIWAFLFHVLIKLLRQKLVQRDEARMSARRRKLGRYLCKAFLKLGPTFIKIGQVSGVWFRLLFVIDSYCCCVPGIYYYTSTIIPDTWYTAAVPGT